MSEFLTQKEACSKALELLGERNRKEREYREEEVRGNRLE